MDSVTLTIHFKNRVRLFYPKHLPGSQLTLAIRKVFDLASDEEIELVDRISHDRVGLSEIQKLPPNSHLVLALMLKHSVRYIPDELNNKRNTLLSKEKTVVVHKENGSFGFQVQYFFAPSHNNLASPYHRMSTIFVKQLDKNGPAARAGLKQGDRILRINDGSVFNLTLEDVVGIMRRREDYVVLTTVPWYKDYLQVEYPDFAYSESSDSVNHSDASTASLERYSSSQPSPSNSVTSPARGNHSNHGNNRRSNLISPPHMRSSLPILLESPKKPGSGRSNRGSDCRLDPYDGSGSSGRPSNHGNTPPIKPPRPNYVLRRHNNDRDYDRSSSGNSQTRYSHSNTRRYGNLEYFNDFQLPEKPPSSSPPQAPELDPLCEALRSQAQVSPSILHKMNTEMSMEGILECKIFDDSNKVGGNVVYQTGYRGIMVNFNISDEIQRHTLRGWSRYFVAVSGPSLSLYKSYADYVEKRDSPEYGPSDISSSLVQIQYRMKKHAFRVICQNHHEYLFKADSHEDMMAWIDKIQQISDVSDNQSLCNQLIKHKADELLKMDNGYEDSNKTKRFSLLRIKEYSPDTCQVNKQYAMKQKDLVLLTEAYNNILANKNCKTFLSKYFSYYGSKAHTICIINRESDFPSFGSTIDKSVKCTDNKLVPAVVVGCIKEVEERGMSTTGIYRLSGNAQAIQALTNEIDKDPRNVNYKQAPWTDISNTCAVLKQYFRRLAEPLVPAHLYPDFMRAVNDNEHREDKLKQLIIKLPDCHYATAKFLFRHLAKVAANADVNMMHTCNLSIIFGPTIIRSDNSDVSTMVTDMSNQCKVVESLISQYSFMFDDDLEAKTPAKQCEEDPVQNKETETEKEDMVSNNPVTNGVDETRPIGWEFHHTIDRNRHVDTADKCTQCNIPKTTTVVSSNNHSNDKIYYRKEPIGIVHPYKDDIVMRPVSRIMDKKLVTIDKSQRLSPGGTSGKPGGSGGGGMKKQVLGPKPSLSLESLLDVISREQREKERSALTKRGCSQQYDTLKRFARALRTSDIPVSGYSGPSSSSERGASLFAAPQKPSHTVPDSRSDTSSCGSGTRKRGAPVAPLRTLPRKCEGNRGVQSRWTESHHHAVPFRQTGHPRLIAPVPSERFRRKSDHVRQNRWQPGQTHKYVLDNNTTLLESTL